jgi:hypothetical protein
MFAYFRLAESVTKNIAEGNAEKKTGAIYFPSLIIDIRSSD